MGAASVPCVDRFFLFARCLASVELPAICNVSTRCCAQQTVCCASPQGSAVPVHSGRCSPVLKLHSAPLACARRRKSSNSLRAIVQVHVGDNSLSAAQGEKTVIVLNRTCSVHLACYRLQQILLHLRLAVIQGDSFGNRP